MNVYVGHSKEINYKYLYKKIREDNELRKFNIILPHEEDANSRNGREFYKTIDIMIAEVTERATGLGIELGWAYDDKKPIYCIYKKGSKISNSLKSVTDNFYEYENIDDCLEYIKSIIKNNRIG